MSILLAASSLRAQIQIGLEGGYSYNRLHTDISNRASTTINHYAGYTLAMPLRYRLRPWLYLTAQPGVVQKNYSTDRTDSFYGVYQRNKNTYLQLPIGVSLVYGKKFRLSIDPGIYLAWWAAGKLKGAAPDIFNPMDSDDPSGQQGERYPINGYSSSYNFQSRRDRRWETGWTLGLGAQYPLARRYWLTANLRYFEALSSQEKLPAGQAPGYNETWTFSIGVLWDCHKNN